MRVWLLAALAVLAIGTTATAQPVRSLAEGAKSPPATLAAVSWLTGRWVGEGLGGYAEDVYSPPRAGVMLGHFRQSKADGSPNFYEIVILREEAGSLVYRVKHFHPDLKGWEEKEVTVDFPLVAVEGERVFFDGLTLERTGPDAMTVTVAIGGAGGRVRNERFTYRRASLP